MALDEPKQDDQVIEAGPCKFVLAPDVVEVLRQSGGIDIDFVSDPQRRGYTVQLAKKSCGDCSCDH
jgi:hypothetical protein